MKLRLKLEDWRDQATGWIDCDEVDEDMLAESLRRGVLNRLIEFDVDEAYQQSVGSFVIFQSGTDAEREAFEAAVEVELSELSEWYEQQGAA